MIGEALSGAHAGGTTIINEGPSYVDTPSYDSGIDFDSSSSFDNDTSGGGSFDW